MTYLFYNWKFIPFDPFHPLCLPPTPGLWQPICSLCLWDWGFCLFLVLFLFLFPHVSESIWYLSFSVWLISLSIMPSRSIHVVTNGKISFFLMAELYRSHFLYSFIHWWTLRLFPYLFLWIEARQKQTNFLVSLWQWVDFFLVYSFPYGVVFHGFQFCFVF